MMKKMVIGTLLLLFMLFLTSETRALVGGNDFFGLDFRFNNPGARANAMGGAFIGLADDATAAYTNPAGLTILTAPEVSAEYKYSEITTQIYDAIGSREFDDTVDGVSFISFAYPSEGTTITVFRHQLLNIESDYDWFDESDEASDVNVELEAVTLGIGLGVKLTETFSAGVSVNFTELQYDVLTLGYDDAAKTTLEERENINDSDTAEHVTLSFLWNPVDTLSLGLVYRQGPKFGSRKSRWSYVYLSPPDEFFWLQEWELDNDLKVPDVFGLGLAYRFTPSFTLAADVNYVEYSDLVDNFKLDPGTTLQDDDFVIDDEFEFRVGLEYIFEAGRIPLAARAGYYFRPDHGVVYNGPDPLFRDILQERDDDDHIYSAGLGAVFDNVQIDLAGIYGDYIKELILSLVYRFE
ncbi:MAG: outer membrane protein transport protein [Desulfobacterales bacterium]|jgi:long-subunit fatty acid transport protein